MDDRGLARAIASGDRDAFRLLVDREGARIYRTCYRIVGRSDEAEDVAQESFVSAFRAIRTFRGEGALAAWLTRIAIRQSFRRLAQRRDAEPFDPGEAGAGDVSGEPLTVALKLERQEAIRGAVAQLPEPYREVVVLRFFGDLHLAEIAAATGRPLGTVKTHLRRGLDRLRDVIDGGVIE